MNRILTLAAGTIVSITCIEPAWGRQADQLPLTEITLYRSGVGSFVRQGSIEGSQKVELQFETGQINDILKSMVVLDLDGGRIDGVSYGSKEPLSRRLASFGVDISQATSMDKLFAQLRGSRLRVTTNEGTFEGVILGVESRKTVIPPTPGGAPGHYDEWYVNLVTDEGVRSIATSLIRTFALADETLASELNKALAALAEHRADRLKTVDIALSGDAGKDRRVVVGYVHEMPVWKTSYRLVLPESGGGESGSKNRPTIQGWAIVENTTDQDWTDVRLSLASGRPVGFQMDLYEPVFVARPFLPIPVGGALTSRTYESGQVLFESLSSAPAPASKAADARESLRQQATNYSGDGTRAAGLELSLAEDAATAQATGGEVGEQFLYTLDAPVTVARQRSAMLPIINTASDGRRISIYNRADMEKHPMRGVELINSTNLHLMPGPVAVYDGGTYAGDAQIPHTSRGQKRLLSYALDIDVRARVEDASRRDMMKLRIVDGLIEQTFMSREQTTYFFESNDTSRARLLMVEHPRLTGWDLKSPGKAAEVTDSLYRFELTVEAGKSASLEVAQERVHLQRIEVMSMELPTIIAYAQSGKASQAVVDAVRKASEIQARINQAQREIEQLQAERQEITQDQSRVRQNMNSMDRNSELYVRYMKKFGDQETRLENIAEQQDKIQQRLNEAQAELNAYLRNLKAD